MATFAPYQDTTPETIRALSPPPASSSPPVPPPSASGRRSFSPSGGRASPRPFNPEVVPSSSRYTDADEDDEAGLAAPTTGGFGFGRRGFGGGSGSGNGAEGGGRGGGGREGIDMFETRLGIRMDYEACLAYLLLPPAGSVMLLVLEHRSDYVRFHAWQASLLFSVIFIVHIIFSWTAIISWLLFACDLLLIGWLVFRAYRDADTLDRCEVPFFGPLASQILDDE
ncbi:hypothetical protein K402DRAFT_393264 [Aulographum hederae CBS 113979]|uniref:Uncharacterized protein n=1 Tax=Aulographum hederae CBS 113979 TaxID=1176131 RepID=A0A6G1H263_9PEZI|nr:hypothetical protein K402DRAFT_393264 [Aulographum hederae CBS 113979]